MYAVTDTTCGHNVIVTVVREHADEQARLADLAGYPTTITAYDATTAVSPPGCSRCWARVAATLVLMLRGRVIAAAEAAEAAGVDPFGAVWAFDTILRLHPELPLAAVVEAVVDTAIPYLAQGGSRAGGGVEDLHPAMFTGSPGPT
jgi:hypothetical protein